MILDWDVIKRLMECFPRGIINHNGEFIAYRQGEAYFNLSTCADETEIKCKVLEWLSRAAHKTAPFDSEKKNEELWAFMQRGINKYLGTNFTADDFAEIYTHLGNRCNRAKTLRFIEAGYDLTVLSEPPKER